MKPCLEAEKPQHCEGYIAGLLARRAEDVTYLEPRARSIFGELPIPILKESLVESAKAGDDRFDVRAIVIAALITVGMNPPVFVRTEQDPELYRRMDAMGGVYLQMLGGLSLPIEQITVDTMNKYAAEGRLIEALVNASALLHIDADNPEYLLAFCRFLTLHAEQEKTAAATAAALTAARRALSAVPGSVDLMDIAGSLCYNSGRFEEAMEHWKNAIRAVRAYEKPDRGALDRFFSNFKSADYQNKLRQAIDLCEQGLSGRALMLLGELEPVFSDYWLFCHYNGCVHYSTGQLASAAHWLSEAVRLNSGDFRSHRLLGVIAFHDGDLSEARRRFNESLKIEPMEAETLGLLAVIDLEEGKTADAASKLRKALEINPADARIRELIASIRPV